MESGLYYLRARFYDPTTAQFITIDPLQMWTNHLYAYEADSPLSHSDPSGLNSEPTPPPSNERPPRSVEGALST